MRKKIVALFTAGVIVMCSGCTTSDSDKITVNNDETKEVATSVELTTAVEESTTEEETTIIEATDDFDINAARVNLPEDRLIEGYDFSDAVFIGDSRTEGLTVYNVLTTSTVLATRGLMASSALTDKFIDMGGSKGTVIDYLKQNTFKKAYVMLGLNELGCNVDSYTGYYKKLIDEIRVAQPELELYVLAIIPMVEERTDEVYNNEVIAKFNEALKGMCEEKKVELVNTAPALINESGTLSEELSNDGIHLNQKGLRKFVNYLILATAD